MKRTWHETPHPRIRATPWAGALLALAILRALSSDGRAADAETGAADHAIQFTRPRKTGLHVNMEIRGSQRSRNVLVTGAKTNAVDTTVSLEFVGASEVLEADPGGHAVKASFTVSRLIRIQNGQRRELLPQGKMFLALARDGTTVFTSLDGTELAPEAALPLSTILAMYHGQADDDLVFGTTTRRVAGESWTVNAAAALKDLEKTQPEIKPRNLAGQVRFLGVTNVAGADCLRLAAEIRVDFQPAQLPAKVEAGACELFARFNTVLPVDATRHALSELTETTLRLRYTGAVGPHGAEGTLETATQRRIEREFKYPE